MPSVELEVYNLCRTSLDNDSRFCYWESSLKLSMSKFEIFLVGRFEKPEGPKGVCFEGERVLEEALRNSFMLVEWWFFTLPPYNKEIMDYLRGEND